MRLIVITFGTLVFLAVFTRPLHQAAENMGPHQQVPSKIQPKSSPWVKVNRQTDSPWKTSRMNKELVPNFGDRNPYLSD